MTHHFIHTTILFERINIQHQNPQKQKQLSHLGFNNESNERKLRLLLFFKQSLQMTRQITCSVQHIFRTPYDCVYVPPCNNAIRQTAWSIKLRKKTGILSCLDFLRYADFMNKCIITEGSYSRVGAIKS